MVRYLELPAGKKDLSDQFVAQTEQDYTQNNQTYKDIHVITLQKKTKNREQYTGDWCEDQQHNTKLDNGLPVSAHQTRKYRRNGGQISMLRNKNRVVNRRFSVRIHIQDPPDQDNSHGQQYPHTE